MREWFVNEYMFSNETLFHKNPVTGEPCVPDPPPLPPCAAHASILTLPAGSPSASGGSTTR